MIGVNLCCEKLQLDNIILLDSAVHRLDPRTKLFGTLVFIISLSLWRIISGLMPWLLYGWLS